VEVCALMSVRISLSLMAYASHASQSLQSADVWLMLSTEVRVKRLLSGGLGGGIAKLRFAAAVGPTNSGGFRRPPPLTWLFFCIKILSLALIHVHAETFPVDAAEIVGKYALTGPQKLNFLHWCICDTVYRIDTAGLVCLFLCLFERKK